MLLPLKALRSTQVGDNKVFSFSDLLLIYFHPFFFQQLTGSFHSHDSGWKNSALKRCGIFLSESMS